MAERSAWICFSTCASSAFSSVSNPVRYVSPSARSLVVSFSVVLATSRNLLPAVEAQGAALLLSGDRIGLRRHVGWGLSFRLLAWSHATKSPHAGDCCAVLSAGALKTSARGDSCGCVGLVGSAYE